MTASPRGGGARIEWLASESIGEAQRFLGENWKRRHILAADAELFVWQHRQPEDRERLSVVVARGDDDELQGMLGVIAAPFCVHGERFPGAWLTTWVVPEAHRAAGIGLRLLQRVMKDTPGLVATLGGNEVTMRLLGGLGFTTWTATPRWVRVVSADPLESLLAAGGVAYPDECWAAWFHEADAGSAAASSETEVGSWAGDSGPAWDAVWSTRFAPQLVGTWRDSEYMRWRYLEHPSFEYRLLLAGGGDSGAVDGLAAYRVQRVQDRPETVVRVVELLGEGSAADALIDAIVRDADTLDAAFIDFYCTASAPASNLERHGFVRDDLLPAGLPALFQPLDPGRTALTGAIRLAPELGRDGPGLLAGSDLYVTRSDCDQDRPN